MKSNGMATGFSPARNKRVRLYTRRGYNWTGKYPQIVEALCSLRLRSCIIDGEAVWAGQGINGNGMAAQRKAVEDYLNGGRWKLVGEFTEGNSAHC